MLFGGAESDARLLARVESGPSFSFALPLLDVILMEQRLVLLRATVSVAEGSPAPVRPQRKEGTLSRALSYPSRSVDCYSTVTVFARFLG